MERRLLTGTNTYISFFYVSTFNLNVINIYLRCRFDGNDIQGYRIYREVNEISKKNAGSDLSCLSWETEATNLDEFQRVAVRF